MEDPSSGVWAALDDLNDSDLSDLEYILNDGISYTEDERRRIQAYKRAVAKGKSPKLPYGIGRRDIELYDKIGFDHVPSLMSKAATAIMSKWNSVKPTPKELFGFLIVSVLSGFFCWLFVKVLGY